MYHSQPEEVRLRKKSNNQKHNLRADLVGMICQLVNLIRFSSQSNQSDRMQQVNIKTMKIK